MLEKWEEFCGWLLPHTGRWNKAARFTFTQRVQNHALDITELLVLARYDKKRRQRLLAQVNLKLERMRHLFRLARGANIMPGAGFETAQRAVDETGRMVFGWRKSLGGRRPVRPDPSDRPNPPEAPE